MVRKLLPLLWATTAVVLLSSCSRNVDKPARLSITFPQASSSLNISQNVSALSSKWGLSDPSVSSQLNCYAIAVESIDSVGAANICSNLATTTVAQPQYIHGGFAAGTSQDIEVPAGKKRVHLIGFQSTSASYCKLLDKSGSGFDKSQFSAPHLLTSSFVNLESGKTTDVSLTVPATLPADSKFEDCAPFAFGRGTTTAPAALSISAITPNIGLSGGGTAVVVTGTGFDASTTVTIGGVACGSAVPTSTSISCTTGAYAPAVYDVVVSKSVETATLVNGFTYTAAPGLSIADVTIAENLGNTLTATVSVSGVAVGDTTVDWATSAGTATSPVDFTAASGTLTILGGASSGVITLNNVVNDTLNEPNETFTITLSNPSANAFLMDATSIVTITDDDPMPTVQFAASTSSLSEAAGSGAIAVNLSAVSGQTVMVNYAVGGGTATGSGVDYILASGTLTFSPGVTSQNITINIIDDVVFEGAETVQVDLSAPTNSTLGGTINHTLTINDDDAPAVLSLSDGPTYDYGSRVSGSSTDHTFTVTNTGGTAATSMNGSGLASPFLFKGGSFPGTGGTCSASLSSGGSCTIVVTFDPVSLGLQTDTIDINYNDGGGAQNSTRNVQGTGIAPAILQFSDSPVYDFGAVAVGDVLSTPLTVNNTGGATATGISASTLATDFQYLGGSYPGTGGTCGSNLAAAATCTIVVQYIPTTPGVATDTIDLNYNDGASPQLATCDVHGVPVLDLLYVAASADNQIRGFSVDSLNNLNPIGNFSTAGSPNWLQVSPDSYALYVGTSSNIRLEQQTIDLYGALSNITYQAFGYTPSHMIFDRFSRWLIFGFDDYLTNAFQVQNWTAVTGAISPVSGSPFTTSNQTGIPAYHPFDDKLFVPYQNSNLLISYTVSGIGTPSVESTANDITAPYGVAVDGGNDRVYVSSYDSAQVIRYDYSGTSLGTAVFFIGTAGDNAANLILHPTLPVLYALSTGSSGSYINRYSIDGTGDLTSTQALNLGTINAPDMVMDVDAKRLYVSDCINNFVKVYTINPGNGDLTFYSNVPAGTCPKGLAVGQRN